MFTVGRKKHLFIDCSGFPWRDDDDARKPHVVEHVKDVTCGQCKQRILNVLAQKDWKMLNNDEECVLAIVAKEVKVDSD